MTVDDLLALCNEVRGHLRGDLALRNSVLSVVGAGKYDTWSRKIDAQYLTIYLDDEIDRRGSPEGYWAKRYSNRDEPPTPAAQAMLDNRHTRTPPSYVRLRPMPPASASAVDAYLAERLALLRRSHAVLRGADGKRVAKMISALEKLPRWTDAVR